ncbi:hypothetical protein NECAME_03521 [Necator americanus]|uniref:phosphatidylinositol-3,5-bisphosphate 3-phosphatase n=1 Tax=Necator americanus TaxID=51031 RepID=W2T2L3_NECAM|nr:hypothetical protein NECAME_03521 [Necator americanus]ETN76148.1 hypothetical protein NECAME_03521 [Necator americanus]
MVHEGTSAIDIPCQDSGDFDGSFVGSPTSYVNIPHVPPAEDLHSIMRRDSEAPHELEVDEHFSPESIVDSGECTTAIKSPPVSEPHPIDLIPGETVKADEELDGELRAILTDYRLCLIAPNNRALRVILLVAIETIDFRDPVQIIISCKEGRVACLRAKSTESAIAWHKMLYKAANRVTCQELFAWHFAKEVNTTSCSWLSSTPLMDDEALVRKEFERLDYDRDHFRISDDNKGFTLSPTYPEYLVIPKEISHKDLVDGKDFRFLQRWPAVVWKCKETRAVLLRSSQPRLSLFGWRNNADEKFFELVHKYLDTYSPGKDMLIMDARSYAAAWANRAKGGGFEHPEYYQRTRVDWLALPNIHNVRYSFHQLRALLCSNQNKTGESYLTALEGTCWLNYVKDLMNSARKCVDTLFDGQSVLVHCSDGWDRTTQIVSLAKLMGDEYYRTVQGFEELIRLEWVAFGHKFADRNGIAGTNTNEQSPIFLQFLDAVHQMQHQLPTAFEFNKQYLIKLAQHAYSGLFGTFLFNSRRESKMMKEEMKEEPVSIWRFLGKHNEQVVSSLYDKAIVGRIAFDTEMSTLREWIEVYRDRAFDEDIAVPSYPTRPGPITAPLKETVTNAATGINPPTPLQKSKSSESINSITNVDAANINGMINHAGSNGTINVSSPEHNLMDTSMVTLGDVTAPPPSSSTRRDTSHALFKSTLHPWKTIQESQDKDGLIKFFDPIEERQRVINKAHQLELERHQLNQMKRNRSFSERTSHGTAYRDVAGRMVSFGDGDSDGDSSLCRALSDVSVVDSCEVPRESSGIPLLRNTHCQICDKPYPMIGVLRPEDAEHRCRLCMLSVCQQCSRQRYHTTEDDGKGVQRRICDRCYQKMIPAEADEDIELQEDASILSLSSSPPRRSSSVGDAKLASSFSYMGSPSQAVKG